MARAKRKKAKQATRLGRWWNSFSRSQKISIAMPLLCTAAAAGMSCLVARITPTGSPTIVVLQQDFIGRQCASEEGGKRDRLRVKESSHMIGPLAAGGTKSFDVDQ